MIPRANPKMSMLSRVVAKCVPYGPAQMCTRPALMYGKYGPHKFGAKIAVFLILFRILFLILVRGAVARVAGF